MNFIEINNINSFVGLFCNFFFINFLKMNFFFITVDTFTVILFLYSHDMIPSEFAGSRKGFVLME
jgi:hypothetical protein